MNAIKIAAIALIAGGLLVLVYGGFSYTTQTHDYKFGTLDLSVYQTQTVDVPFWAGIAAIGAGALLLLMGGKK